MLILVMACVVVSCGSSSSGGEQVTAKFLTEDEFAKSSWKGVFNDNELSLDVTSKTSMTLKYYEKKEAISKNTNPDPTYEQKTVTITYSFDAAKGVATGSADNVAYVGTLTAKDKMDFTMGSESVKLSKK